MAECQPRNPGGTLTPHRRSEAVGGTASCRDVGRSIAEGLLATAQKTSLTACDRERYAPIKNVDRASRASNNAEVKKNPDTSVALIYRSESARTGNQLDPNRRDPEGFSIPRRRTLSAGPIGSRMAGIGAHPSHSRSFRPRSAN
jgi:hypothetical protein